MTGLTTGRPTPDGRFVRAMRTVFVPLVVTSLLVGSCSAGDPEPDTRPDDAPAVTAPEGSDRTECDQGPSLREIEATPVAGVETDYDLTSFDGTTIRFHWFPVDGATADEPAPTILMGPGWSESGDTSTTGSVLFDSLAIPGLWDQGYNVLTWDPRGFGESGGEATVNDPELEGRDVRGLIDWVATQEVASIDTEGDPRIGMVGFSYGGGIQLTVAATDCRVDAIVPGLAWHSLETGLYKAETVKAGWADLLTSAASAASLDPHIASASASGSETGTLSAEDRQWFVDRGPGDLVADITAPTLFVQGTVDGLFTLDEATTNYGLLRSGDVPTAMIWFCGGHGFCLTDEGDPDRVADATFAWLDRHLKGTTAAETGPALDLIDQNGQRWSADDYPTELGDPVTASGSGTLGLTAQGGSNGVDTPPGDDILGGVVAGITPSRADNAVEVTIDAGDVDGLVLGAPRLSFTYQGTTPDGPEPTRVFAQLIDDASGIVVGNQITPVAVTLDGSTRTAETELEIVAHHLRPGSTLTLQLVATTTAYATPRLGGSITFDTIDISLPVAEGVTQG